MRPGYWLVRAFAILGLAPAAHAATAEQAFWAWFEKNQTAYFELDPRNAAAREPLFSALQVQLGKIDDNLTFEFGPEIEGRRELVISADGIKSAFPAVKAVVAAAPALERWKITPFRPRRYPVSIIETGVVKLDPEQIFVQLADDNGLIALRLFMPGFSEAERQKYAQAAYLLLDEALGEYDVEMKVGGIDFQPLGTEQPPNSVKLSELGRTFDKASPTTIH